MGSAKRVKLSFTPNPNTLKFVLGTTLLERGTVNFVNPAQTQHSPLVTKLFQISGVEAVLVGSNFVTLTKTARQNWDGIAPQATQTLESFMDSGEGVFVAGFDGGVAPDSSTETEQRIRSILDNEIRPFVAHDGGDIVFDRYEDGVVYLHLQGACRSCPGALATLKMGVEARLKEEIPEIKEVVRV